MVVVGHWTMMAWKMTTTGRGWRTGGPLSIKDKEDRTGGATGFEGEGTGRATATASSLASSALIDGGVFK
jgi:hypothetical protein